MARVRFVEPFNYVPSRARHTAIVYQAGRERTVKRECAIAAVAARAAVEIPPPPRPGRGDDA
jgi:hypothetical protein